MCKFHAAKSKRCNINTYLIFGILVPEYEVISPYQSDESGNIVDYVLHGQTRTRRATNEPKFWYFKMEAFGRSFHLKVAKTTPHITSGAVVETVDDKGKSTYKEVPRSVYYTGHVTSDPESLVAISGNKGLVSETPVIKEGLLYSGGLAV